MKIKELKSEESNIYKIQRYLDYLLGIRMAILCYIHPEYLPKVRRLWTFWTNRVDILMTGQIAREEVNKDAETTT